MQRDVSNHLYEYRGKVFIDNVCLIVESIDHGEGSVHGERGLWTTCQFADCLCG